MAPETDKRAAWPWRYTNRLGHRVAVTPAPKGKVRIFTGFAGCDIEPAEVKNLLAALRDAVAAEGVDPQDLTWSDLPGPKERRRQWDRDMNRETVTPEELNHLQHVDRCRICTDGGRSGHHIACKLSATDAARVIYVDGNSILMDAFAWSGPEDEMSPALKRIRDNPATEVPALLRRVQKAASRELLRDVPPVPEPTRPRASKPHRTRRTPEPTAPLFDDEEAS